MEYLSLIADILGVAGVLFALFAWLQSRRTAQKMAETAKAVEAHRAAHAGWRAVVKRGEEVLFTENLTVEEADQLLDENRTAPARTGEARRLGQSAVTSFGMSSIPVYDVTTVEQDARTVTFHLELDTGFQWRKAPATTPVTK